MNSDRIDRFWAKVDRSGGDDCCWPWTGTTDGYGYARWLKFDSSGRRFFHASSRVSYELLVGPIPEGKVLAHICYNRACVNPAHTALMTRRELAFWGSSFAVVNAAFGGSVVVTAEQVAKIRTALDLHASMVANGESRTITSMQAWPIAIADILRNVND